MAIIFPDTTNQPTDGTFTHTESGITYIWDGSSWSAGGVSAESAETLSTVTARGNSTDSGISLNNSNLNSSAGHIYFNDSSNEQHIGWTQREGVIRQYNNRLRIMGGDPYEEMAVFNVDGSVELHHDANKKIETTSNGVTIFGDGLATGINLSADYESVSNANAGDIKRINNHPHYYDGTKWYPFYLTGTPTSPVASDVHFDDVEVRVTFDNNVAFNYINLKTIELTGLPASSGGTVGTVSSPVKFGNSSLRLKTLPVQSDPGLGYWTIPDINATAPPASIPANEEWPSIKRGGNIDWSEDWTVEFWVKFDSVPGTNDRFGIFSASRDADRNTDDGKRTIGVVMIGVEAQDSGNMYQIQWRNDLDSNGANTQYLGSLLESEIADWIHLAFTRRASDGNIFLHVNGVPRTQSAVYDTNIDKTLIQSGAITRLGLYPGSDWTIGCDLYMDDLRITQFARYSPDESFAVPTQAFPVTADPPPIADTDWDNVILRSTFDNDLDDVSKYNETGVSRPSEVGVNINDQIYKYGNGSAYFTSIGQWVYYGNYLSSPQFDLYGTWTIEFWINFQYFGDYDSVYGTRMSVFSLTSNANIDSNASFGLFRRSSLAAGDFVWYWRVGDNAYVLHHDSIYTNQLQDIWNHVAITKEANGDMAVYFNGYRLRFNPTDQGRFRDIYLTPPISPNDPEFRLSHPYLSVNGGENGFAGFLDDFRWTSTVKYTDNFTPPTGPLPAVQSTTPQPDEPSKITLSYPTTTGNDGQVLTSDGTGGVIWEDTGLQDLQEVTDQGATTDKDITVGGLVSNGSAVFEDGISFDNDTVEPTGVDRQVKVINNKPHYYDGANWREFYLLPVGDVPLPPTAPDGEYNNVFLRLPFDTDKNDVSSGTKLIRTEPNGSAGVFITDEIYKYGGGSLALRNSGSVYYEPNQYSDPRGFIEDGDFTFELWFLCDGDVQEGIFTAAQGTQIGNGVTGFALRRNADGRLTFSIESSTKTLRNETLSIYASQTWHHVAVVRSNSQTSGVISLFVNGDRIWTDNDNGLFPMINYVYLGRYSIVGVPSAVNDNMYIDDVRFTMDARYDATASSITVPSGKLPVDFPVLTDPNWNDVVLRVNFENNSTADLSPNNSNILTIGGVVYNSACKWNNVGMQFNTGTTSGGHMIYNLINDKSGDFTIEFWHYTQSLNVGLPEDVPTAIATFTWDGDRTFVFGINSSYNFGLWQYSAGPETYTKVVSGNNINANSSYSWKHFAIVNESNELSFYVDGVKSNDSYTGSDFDDLRYVGLGGLAGSLYANGSFYDDLRVTMKALYTDAQITVPFAPFPITGSGRYLPEEELKTTLENSNNFSEFKTAMLDLLGSNNNGGNGSGGGGY